MPLARIDLPAGTSETFKQLVGDVVYDMLVDILQAPQSDRFQIIAEHAPGALIMDPTYLGIQRSPNALIIQITLNEGRSIEMKKSFYKALADGLHERAGVRREDVFINLIEVKKENWSFGNGVAQYA